MTSVQSDVQLISDDFFNSVITYGKEHFHRSSEVFRRCLKISGSEESSVSRLRGNGCHFAHLIIEMLLNKNRNNN